MIKNKHIYYKFIVCLLFFSLCITSLSVFLINQHNQNVLDASVAENTAFLQQSAMSATQAFAVSSSRAVRTLWESEELDSFIDTGSEASFNMLERLMQNILKMSFSYYRVDVTGADGVVLLSLARSDNGMVHKQLHRHEVCQLPESQPENNYEVWFSEITLNQASSTDSAFHTMSVSKPLYRQNLFVGQVVLYLNMDFLLEVLTRNGNLDAYLMNEHGRIIATSLPAEMTYPSAQPVLFQTLSGVSDIHSEDAMHEKGFSVQNLVNLPSLGGLKLISHAATQFIAAREEEYRNSLIKIALIVMSFSVFSGMMIAINPSRTMRQLEIVSRDRSRYMKLLDQYVPVLETDIHGLITRVTQAFTDISGYSEEELLGKSAAALSFSQNDEQMAEVWGILESGLPWQGEFHNRTQNGSEFWIFSTVIPMYKDEKNLTGYMSISIDRTERKQLEVFAETDALTEIYNRRKIDRILQQECERSKRYGSLFSVLMMDIDHFKRVNDRYGHLVGDKVLNRLAVLLNDNTRSVDEVGRWGGEEFLVVCPETDLDSAVIAAEKIRKAIQQYDFPDIDHLTISIGVEVYKPDQGLKETLEQADYYLYQAKKKGRNRVISRLSRKKE